jgi:ProQ/FINO family
MTRLAAPPAAVRAAERLRLVPAPSPLKRSALSDERAARLEARNQLLALLREITRVFNEPQVALAIGIRRQIAELACPEFDWGTIAWLCRWWWCRRHNYLAVVAAGGSRFNLSGSVVGPVSVAHQALATRAPQEYRRNRSGRGADPPEKHGLASGQGEDRDPQHVSSVPPLPPLPPLGKRPGKPYEPRTTPHRAPAPAQRRGRGRLRGCGRLRS